ncbi:(2Fe-2S)-binding protein [Pedococcus bigeumensis]|uniref:(2Fe-2S)-binding protein n=1 Tax=Pedococcus bigeumensis TaxID=433644 RepID=A0A502CPN2_9MICO|nr:(2Fe-2S)-binding protein [Pedococcus bigeumensis]TPG14858.1 (2Fe-2S)-binding protein [Pedococcus bigeumensis]
MSTARQYAAVVPSSMPSAFVLQWTLEVAAEVGVYAARHHSWIVHPADSGLTFALQPTQLYPVAAQFRRRTVTPALLDDRLEAARAAYRVDAVELALGYRSDANLGKRTRLAMVDDVWAMTLARARGQRPPERGSCCFIYVLPGVHECSGCPRLSATPSSDVTGSGT